jgi:hypothetical protein
VAFDNHDAADEASVNVFWYAYRNGWVLLFRFIYGFFLTLPQKKNTRLL